MKDAHECVQRPDLINDTKYWKAATAAGRQQIKGDEEVTPYF